jgi:hypothetical protein
MKRLLICGLCLITIFTSFGAACVNGATDSPPSQTPAAGPVSEQQSGAAVNVDDLMTSPEQYTGQLYLLGVVSFVSPEQRTLGLIDSREFAECGVTTCSSFILPVKWDGPMPQVEDTVEVTGEVQKSGSKFVFIARSLEKSAP